MNTQDELSSFYMTWHLSFVWGMSSYFTQDTIASTYDKVYTKLLTFSSKWAVSKIVLMINWFLNLISICIRVTGIHFVLQNSFISSYFPNFQCKFEFSALMEFFSSCAQRRFFLINYNAVCFLIIFPLNLMHKPQWEK